MTSKTHEPLIPFLQPAWGFRATINETLVDSMGDNAHRRSAAFLLYSAAVLSAMARATAVGPLSGGIELVLSLALAYFVLRLVEPIIKYRHDMKFPDIAITPYVGVLGFVVKLIVGVRIFTVLNVLVHGGNIGASVGTLSSLLLFQVAMVVVLDDGERPLRRTFAPVV